MPYGFGLSYTSFAFSGLSVKRDESGLTASVTVTNTGEREGDEIVQLYVGYPDSAVDRPLRQLRGFERVSLRSGESKLVTIACPAEKLKYYEPTTREWILENGPICVSVGSSEAEQDLISVTV